MNITLRPSGGRGEYELAGRQGDLHVQDLFGIAMFLEILPGIAINAHSNCVLKDGKPRIRLTQQARDAHPSALIAAAMLLPMPRRSRHDTHGTSLLRWKEFVVQAVRVDVAPRVGGVLIRPVTVRLENGDNARLDINFAERMARVVRIWAAVATVQGKIADAVRNHASAFTAANATQAQMATAIPKLYIALHQPEGDLLPILEAFVGLGAITAPPVGPISAEIADIDFEEEIQIDASEARIERVRQWRLAAVRGSSASAFRRNVRDAYDARCIFSGQRLPRTDATSTAGVDAAHILPWSRFDLDSPSNGLCLNKQCHWAFDEGLLRLAYEEDQNAYVISIPDEFRTAANAANFEMGSFDLLAGIIPESRLPQNPLLWPSKAYLAELNRFLDDEAA